MKALMMIAVLAAVACGSYTLSTAHSTALDTQDPIPDQVLLQQAVTAGAHCLTVTNDGPSALIRIWADDTRIDELEIKGAGKAVVLCFDLPDSVLLVTAAPDAGPITVTLD